MGKIKDFTGKIFGRLTVISFAGLKNRRNAQWLCRCECGEEKIVSGANLTGGGTTSCGCLALEIRKSLHITHGQTRRHGQRTAEYRAWAGMKNRCTNSNFPEFKYYGGKGISVCEEWMNSFETFFSHVGKRPSKDHSLDRWPNKNGNYEPGNVRWATREQQSNNQVKNVIILYNGEQKTLAEWCHILGLKYGLVQSRLYKGYSIEDAFNTPAGGLTFSRPINMPSEESIKELVKRSSKAVWQYSITGEFISEYTSSAEAARTLGFSSSTIISNCLNGRSKTGGGFVWKPSVSMGEIKYSFGYIN